jgi:hypothetical protein
MTLEKLIAMTINEAASHMSKLADAITVAADRMDRIGSQQSAEDQRLGHPRDLRGDDEATYGRFSASSDAYDAAQKDYHAALAAYRSDGEVLRSRFPDA